MVVQRKKKLKTPNRLKLTDITRPTRDITGFPEFAKGSLL